MKIAVLSLKSSSRKSFLKSVIQNKGIKKIIIKSAVALILIYIFNISNCQWNFSVTAKNIYFTAKNVILLQFSINTGGIIIFTVYHFPNYCFIIFSRIVARF